jgi:Protein of unknown function (DUF2849)
MSKRTPAISVLTANRLRDGIVVFLGADGVWVESIESAAVARSPEEAQALEARGARDSVANLVVEPYLAEVREVGGRLVPARVRERVRVDGPSVLDDVPGYVPPSPRTGPPSPHSSPTSPRTPSARGEGWGERQPHTPTSAPAPAPLVAPVERVEGSELRGETESAEAA